MIIMWMADSTLNGIYKISGISEVRDDMVIFHHGTMDYIEGKDYKYFYKGDEAWDWLLARAVDSFKQREEAYKVAKDNLSKVIKLGFADIGCKVPWEE